MDPMSALSVASAVVTFIDFSWGLVTGAMEVYRSLDGALEENGGLEDVMDDLELVVNDLAKNTSASSKAERSIRRLAKDCREDADVLLGILRKLKVSGKRTAWKSLKAQWANLVAKSEVQELKERLQEYRSEILLNLTLLIRDDNSELGKALKRIHNDCKDLRVSFSDDLKACQDNLIREIQSMAAKTGDITDVGVEDSHKSLAGIGRKLDDLKKLSTEIPVQHRLLRQLVYSDMRDRHAQIYKADAGTCGWLFDHDDDSQEQSDLELESEDAWENESSSNEASSNEAIQNTDGNENHHAIANESNTGYGTAACEPADAFEGGDTSTDDLNDTKDTSHSDVKKELEAAVVMIRDHGMTRKSTRSLVRAWLREGQNVFHISGKAGSGKSTLMKFIARHECTKQHLQKWAGPKRLVIADFYFWNSGTYLQSTLSGLLRSLLYEILSHCSELVAEVFPMQWNRYSTGPGDVAVESVDFTEDCIQAAFKVLLQKNLHAKYKFCFFIDGLDEYAGNVLEHERLAKLLKSWTEGEDIKICATSRPHREFVELFNYRENPAIHLHLLNKPDIRAYCQHRLSEDTEVQKTGRSYADLVDHIADSSHGVFLWAHLVIDIILIAVRQGDSDDILIRKLRAIPPELNDLYDKMRKHVEKSPIDRIRSNRILFLATFDPFEAPLALVAYSFLDELQDPAFPHAQICQKYSKAEIEARTKHAGKQVNSLARGLLEVVQPLYHGIACIDSLSIADISDLRTNLQVRFAHRTARDYLLDNAERVRSLQASIPDFVRAHGFDRLRVAEMLCLELQPGQLQLLLCQDTTLKTPIGRWFCHYRSSWYGDLVKTIPNTDLSQQMQAAIQVIEDEGNKMKVFVTSTQEKGYLVNTRYADYCQHFVYPRSELPGAKGSFIHYAASEGMSSVVLGSLEGKSQPDGNDNDLSLLISALYGMQYELAYNLLEQGVELNDLICVEEIPITKAINAHVHAIRRHCPVWLAAMFLIFEHDVAAIVTNDDQHQDEQPFLIRVLQHLTEHADIQAQSFSPSLRLNHHTSKKLQIPKNYLFKLQDVLARIGLKTSTTKAAIEGAMQVHVLDMSSTEVFFSIRTI